MKSWHTVSIVGEIRDEMLLEFLGVVRMYKVKLGDLVLTQHLLEADVYLPEETTREFVVNLEKIPDVLGIGIIKKEGATTHVCAAE